MIERDRHIQLQLQHTGLTEDDLLGFVEGTLGEADLPRVVRALGASPALSELALSMRADQQRLMRTLDAEIRALEPDRTLVDAAVAQGVTGRIPPELARAIEASPHGSLPVHRVTMVRGRRRARAASLLRSPRWSAALGTALAACVVVGLIGILRLSWPASAPTRPAPGPLATDDIAAPGARRADLSAEPTVAAATGAEDERGRTRATPSRPLDAPVRIASAAEALEAAREGRLLIRLASSDGRAATELIGTITTQPSVSRVAVLEGAVSASSARALAAALPVPTAPVFASREGETDGVRVASPRRVPMGGYMLEVEPTERGFSLLLAGLQREPGVLVQLIRTAEPVTTPGSASDAAWFRGPSRDWQPRIAAPVVVESLTTDEAG
ncbi:MAG: hypothetical protein ACTS22_07165 [Phycisphaerales bacterium]